MFIVVCLGVGGFMIYTSQLCFNFEVITSTMVDEICTQEKTIGLKEDIHQLVDLWMCTPDCRCYSGANGEVEQKWRNYGNDALAIYGRNAGDKMLEI